MLRLCDISVQNNPYSASPPAHRTAYQSNRPKIWRSYSALAQIPDWWLDQTISPFKMPISALLFCVNVLEQVITQTSKMVLICVTQNIIYNQMSLNVKPMLGGLYRQVRIPWFLQACF